MTLNVLVVEDSPPQREMMTKILQESGMSVRAAADGLEALHLIQAECPDVLVLDVVMPRMNGYELCRKLRADSKTEKIKVVMCSTKGEEFDRYWGLRQGADAYIAKPFQPAELISTIKQLTREPA
ncbi:MAG: response regulator transcription factor [Pseudanabaenaceae cyanobacterium]